LTGKAQRHLGRPYYAYVMLGKAGWRVTLRFLWSRIYSRRIFVLAANDVTLDYRPYRAKINYSLVIDPPDLIEQLLSKLDNEKGQDVLEMLRLIYFHQWGIGSCIAAFTESGDLCFVIWHIFPKDNDAIKSHYPKGMRLLEDGEVLVEYAFTFSQYRNLGIHSAVSFDRFEMLKNQGYRQALGYIDEKNKPSLKALKNMGSKIIGIERELRLLFTSRIRSEVCVDAEKNLNEGKNKEE
jgi:hypothetical protein